MGMLVSVVVVTFNSEKYIYEILDSILNQTYKDLEVIISDDCSKDNTVSIAKEFFESNSFDKFKIITSKCNTGVPSNINRGLKKATGKYIKIIAADDILLNNCIEKNMLFMHANKNLIQFSNMKGFIKNDYGEKIITNYYKLSEKYNNRDINKQLNMLMYRNYVHAPTVFFDRELFEKYGLFNEKFKLLDDYPMWIKISENREPIYYLNSDTVLYRQHSESLSYSNKININYFNNFKKFFYEELEPCLIRNRRYLSLIHHKITILKNESILRQNNIKRWYIKLYNFLDPLFMYNKIKSMFIKEQTS